MKKEELNKKISEHIKAMINIETMLKHLFERNYTYVEFLNFAHFLGLLVPHLENVVYAKNSCNRSKFLSKGYKEFIFELAADAIEIHKRTAIDSLEEYEH